MITVFIGMLDTDEEKHKLTRIYEKYYGTMLGVAKSILITMLLLKMPYQNQSWQL